MSSLKQTQTKKSLETRKTKVELEIDDLKRDLKLIEQSLFEKKKLLKNINTQLQKIQIKPTVSEHAVLRFIERHYNINIDEIKKMILTDNLKIQIERLGSGKFPLNNGCRAVVKDKCIVSVV